jgi:hypothetical protein
MQAAQAQRYWSLDAGYPQTESCVCSEPDRSGGIPSIQKQASSIMLLFVTNLRYKT